MASTWWRLPARNRAQPQPLLGCRHPQHPGPPSRCDAGNHHSNPARASSAARATGRLRPLMERTQVLDLMGTLKLYGLRSAYDEVMAQPSSASTNRPGSSAICSRPKYPRSRPARSNTSSPSPSCRWPRTSRIFDFDGTPVNEALIRDLANGTFVADQRNAALLTGSAVKISNARG